MAYTNYEPRLILYEYNFIPDDSPFTPTEQPSTTTKFEHTDGADDHEIFNFANPGLSASILVKFKEP